MASSPESYAVEREFAESMDDPFEAILELRAQLLDAKRNEERAVARVAELESEQLAVRTEWMTQRMVILLHDDATSKLHTIEADPEIGDLQSLVLKLESELVGLRADFSGLQHRAKRELDECARLQRERDSAHMERNRANIRIHTLEAAVRELQRWSPEMDGQPDLSRLYALVPEVGA